MTDLTKVKTNNPTKALEAGYAGLMDETCPRRLADSALTLVRQAGGVSPKNLRRFEVTVTGLAGDIAGLKRYITNFILAGSGLVVVKPGRCF